MNRNAFIKADTRLTQKKEELFKNPNISRWDISPEELKKCDKNVLVKNKDYAFSRMMHKVYIIYDI